MSNDNSQEDVRLNLNATFPIAFLKMIYLFSSLYHTNIQDMNSNVWFENSQNLYRKQNKSPETKALAAAKTVSSMLDAIAHR